MTDYKAGHHDKEEDAGHREHSEKVGVQANEGVDSKGGESVGGLLPLDEPYQTVLEYKYHPDSTYHRG